MCSVLEYAQRVLPIYIVKGPQFISIVWCISATCVFYSSIDWWLTGVAGWDHHIDTPYMKYGCAKAAQIRSNRPHLNETFTTWMRVHKTMDHEREIPNECLYCIILIIHTHAATIYYYVCCVSSRWKHMFVKAKDLLSFKRYARANTQLNTRLFYIFILVFFSPMRCPSTVGEQWMLRAYEVDGHTCFLHFNFSML